MSPGNPGPQGHSRSTPSTSRHPYSKARLVLALFTPTQQSYEEAYCFPQLTGERTDMQGWRDLPKDVCRARWGPAAPPVSEHPTAAQNCPELPL